MSIIRSRIMSLFPASILVVAVLCVLSPFAAAEDLNPPPWRGDPLTTAAEWEFLTNTTSLNPDGNDVTLVTGDGLLGTDPVATIIGNMTWDPFDGDGAWISTGLPGEFGYIELIIPNWIDDEPVKYLQIQMTVQPGGGTPFVDTIVPADSAEPIAGVFLTNVIQVPILGPNGLEQRTEYWEIYPNPDSEVITIAVPTDSLVDEIVVDTLSVPEPSSFVLAIGALIALVVVGRWRR